LRPFGIGNQRNVLRGIRASFFWSSSFHRGQNKKRKIK
jgi:hypothetical protein